MACNNVTLAGIGIECNGSVGGVKTVWLHIADGVTATYSTSSNDVSAITLPSGSQPFRKYNFRRETANMTSNYTFNPANNNQYVATDLVMPFNRMDKVKRLEISALAIGECVGVVEDLNGKFWYLGFDEPMVATAGTGETGTARGDRNGYSITLQDTSKEMPYEVDPELIKSSSLFEQ